MKYWTSYLTRYYLAGAFAPATKPAVDIDKALAEYSKQIDAWVFSQGVAFGDDFDPSAMSCHPAKPAVCECGSTACGSGAHSDWCPLYEAGQ